MLTNGTKRRIDTARDILVGKLPDPKSQVEQITIALIYKFMDDMDKQAEELGGKAKFFTGEYAKYAWSKIFDPRVSGHELVVLYGEAIQKMNQNPNIPQLFRDIFKNAYLPYRDPETLKSFLKAIGEFEYDHSEKLGDAFEYLLSVMGSQGDAGQFRTPRHIIDFIVKVVDPGKNETILDPACGTAGFLISSYKHILEKNKKDGRVHLTPAQKKRLIENFAGYDISPDMVRLSLVNMYLHGFKNPKIYEYDTLTSEEKWQEVFDVILANPPFMSPKGGIRPHKRFSVQAKRSEVLFVDYIAEHLNPNGRAGIIVPEGIIFQSGTAYKKLRKMLVDHSLYAVVSLPAGVFNPYSGVKTSILLLDKNLAKKTDKILFVKINNDGFGLGAQRRGVKGSDLPLALEILHSFCHSLEGCHSREGGNPDWTPDQAGGDKLAHFVAKEKIAESGDYNLSGDRYKEEIIYSGKWDFVELGEVCNFVRGVTYSKTDEIDTDKGFGVLRANNIDIDNKLNLDEIRYISSDLNLPDDKKIKKNDIFMCIASGSKKHLGKVAFIGDELPFYFGGFMATVRTNNKIIPKYLFYNFISNPYSKFVENLTVGVNINNLKGSQLMSFKIPLPPLEVQEQIVAELDNYQKIIDGAKQVVENYKPHINIDLDWEMVEIGDTFKTSSGGTPLKNKSEYYENGKIPWLRSGEVSQGKIYKAEKFITGKGFKNSSAKLFPVNTVLVAMYGATAGQVGLLKFEATTNQAICGIFPNKKTLPEFLFYYLLMQTDYMISLSTGGAQPNISQTIIRKIKIPLIRIEDQKQIVDRIENEQQIVNANKQLIEIYEQKIKDRIAKVWGEKVV